MAELITLTSPPPRPSQLTSYTVSELRFDWANARIEIALLGSNGDITRHSYNGPTATAMMVALNKANLSTTSLQKRVLQQLIADAVIAGTISGSPD